VTADSRLTTGASLPRAQLHDHIPALLEDFERRLRAGAGDQAAAADEQREDAAAHGLHRWQQGFNLEEVTRELGCLNECVMVELDDYAALRPSIEQGAMAEARRIWAALHSVAISSSISQYSRLQQMEAASHVSDLEQALTSLRELEARRAELWQQAAHDLRGNLGVVATAAAGLASAKASADAREHLLSLLGRNVRALHRLLEDVTSLARLQGGQERRLVTGMDATPLLREVCQSMQPLAEEKALFLRFDGPPECNVEGDPIKIRRIVQNLVLNAVRYTVHGGITVTWGLNRDADAERWFMQIQDTGPGFHAGPGSEVVGALEVATGQAEDVAADAISGEITHVHAEASALHHASRDTRGVVQQPGEGIGLSIVKRLCELLDATMELDSKPSQGTTFRILLPMHYGA
jgi:signal transduction histidine kinase